jgi:hypothetical protein
MATTPKPAAGTSEQLAAANREYKELAARIGELGLIHHGSLVHRYANPPTGTPTRTPFYQWSSKVNGKTVTRNLTDKEAKLYKEWIDNDRELRTIIKAMRQASEQATQLILGNEVK